MKRVLNMALAALLLPFMLAAGCGGGPKQAELTVSAAVSLKDVLAEIQTDYQKKNPNVKLILNLGASGSLQRQIEQGAPADLFVSASPGQMDELEAGNLVLKATRKNLAENRLVLIVPQNATLGITGFEDLAKAQVKQIGVGEPTAVPAGQYARQVLTKLGVWDALKGKAVLAKDARTVLTYVETGNVDAGIVYKTDAAASTKVKVVATAPEGSHRPIVYPAAVLAGSKNQKAAEEFLSYMAGPEGKAVFEKYGFAAGK